VLYFASTIFLLELIF